ncbi:hypothetical protein W97_06030 [Coniosporium apollinis CBS 100218]|uniref:Diphthine--ammonia ligase n=1 Tax=Coniosporium apollinis (strain CBS 100218) TaxID=1168221 RepID=R7YY00_CONA1|nr:uncharacterized protein W97_06030 [Coniosporium apollinis CBS 100218]EON66782.1 hypothetical protein W97_06030 [Coniosporium apollinis CBS 100218]
MSPTKHKVIALISGGKDSLFSLLHCLANGHEIVALANLYPAPSPSATTSDDGEGPDIDSYMYQTVGHSLIPLYEEALNLPLYRQPILGSALCTARDYAPSPSVPSTAAEGRGSAAPATADEDETESLVPLLQQVLLAHPDATALSTGAILSTYQRTRIESVALRLGLVPLAFLWQYPYLPPYAQTSLLSDMAALGMDARIIKVASGGLDEGFLGLNVADPRTVARLVGRMRRFGGGGGGAVLGEGGEFETLAVRGPGVLWRGKIELGGTEAMVGEGGSVVLRIKGARVVENEDGEEDGGLSSLRIPALLDDEFKMLWQRLRELDTENTTAARIQQSTPTQPGPPISLSETWITTQTPTALHISNMTSPTADLTAATQMYSIMAHLAFVLASHNLPPSSIISSTLLLRSMSSFTSINPIYGHLFTASNPPSRVTVACGDALPYGVEVVLSVVVDLRGEGGEGGGGLHVQSRSYWAPANIGPYSQAKSLRMAPLTAGEYQDGQGEGPREVFVAGQIPLVPASMEIIGPNDLKRAGLEVGGDKMGEFRAQTVLALQHLWRVGRAVNVQWWTGGVAFLAKCTEGEATARARVAGRAWRDLHRVLGEAGRGNSEDEEELDVWDLKNGVTHQPNANESADGDGRPPLPDSSIVQISSQEQSPTPPCIVVQVDELPRGAAIEWTSVGLADCSRIDFEEVSLSPGLPSYKTQVAGTDSCMVWSEIATPDRIWLVDHLLDHPDNSPSGQRGRQTTVYTSESLNLRWLKTTSAQIIPCRRLWDVDGSEIAASVLSRVW